MNIEDIYWHDGILTSLLVRASGEVILKCNLYPTENSKIRELFNISCSGVDAVICTVDLVALMDNARSGNVTTGKISITSKNRSSLKIFLVDGYIDISSEKILVDMDAQG